MRKLAKWFEEALESYLKLMGNTYEWGGRLKAMEYTEKSNQINNKK